MKIIIPIVILIVLNIACINSNHSTNDTQLHFTKKQTKELIELIINHPEIEQYLHPEVPGRLPLAILKNDYTKASPNMVKFGQRILFLSKDEIIEHNVDSYLEFPKIIKISNEVLEVQMHYPIEGVKGKFLINTKSEMFIKKDVVFEY